MGQIEIKSMTLGMVATNCYLIINKENKEALLVDPADNALRISNVIEENGCTLKAILLTHGHFDHIMGLNSLKQALNAEAVICKDDLVISDNVNEFTRLFGLPDSIPPVYEKYIKDNDIINVGELKIKVIHTPGHTEGGVCYLIEDKLFSGDTLFRESVGRTDLFGGSFEKLSDSIKNKLFKLDDNIIVYPGHGDLTTIGHEKKYNIEV